jgi:hypothetical protein
LSRSWKTPEKSSAGRSFEAACGLNGIVLEAFFKPTCSDSKPMDVGAEALSTEKDQRGRAAGEDGRNTADLLIRSALKQRK